MQARAHTHTHTHTHACIHTCTHTRACIHTRTYADTHTHTRTHTHSPTSPTSQSHKDTDDTEGIENNSKGKTRWSQTNDFPVPERRWRARRILIIGLFKQQVSILKVTTHLSPVLKREVNCLLNYKFSAEIYADIIVWSNSNIHLPLPEEPVALLPDGHFTPVFGHFYWDFIHTENRYQNCRS